MAGLSSPGSEAAVSPGLVSSVTPVPASDVSQQSSDNESGGAKDENGQDIVCVVCNDKSSGKHYGQFTCEGRGSLNTSYALSNPGSACAQCPLSVQRTANHFTHHTAHLPGCIRSLCALQLY